MQVPLEWIKELINIETVKLDELIEKLTLGGFEVEEVLEVEVNNRQQTVLDISATANRSDSLSIQGISLEIASLLNKQIKDVSYIEKIAEWEKLIYSQSEAFLSELGCSTFLTIEVRNINDFTSPSWIQEKLLSSGIIPTNDLADFQTYILLETGYPFAFYDLEKIHEKSGNFSMNFSIVNPKTEQEFLAANNSKYRLNNSNLIIKVNNYPISIAGIIENQEVSCSDTTNSLLIEGSIFNAAVIRQQSRNLGLRTDRSARYEKSLKQTYLIESFYRLISLLRVKNPTLKCKICAFLQTQEQPLKSIELRYQTITEILGPVAQENSSNYSFILPEQISEYLKRLNFNFSYDPLNLEWKVQIPFLRSDDITREIDLIEEVGRLHGFNNFLTTLPKITKIGNEDLSYKTRKKITSCLLNLGFNELIHYSLVGQDQPTNNRNEINLINPLVSDYKNLRTSLLPTLLQTVTTNLKQSNRIIEGFEYGHVFSGSIPNNFKEVEYVAGVFGGTKERLAWSEPEKALTWFEAKGKIEQLFEQLNVVINWTNNLITLSEKILHPYRTAELHFLNGEKIGKFGQIHPAYANKFGLPSNIYLFEFSLKSVQDQIQKNQLPLFQEYSSYPRITKDLSFIIDTNVTFTELKNVLYLNGTKFLSEVNLLDEYRGSSIPENSTSLCFQLIFQSNEKTLANKEIENIILNLQSVLTNKFNAIIRN